MMDKLITRLNPLSGFDDRIGPSLKVQRQIETQIRELFESYGYQEYLPPMLERAEIYGEGVAFDPTPWIEDTIPTPKTWNATVKREFLPIEITDFRGDTPLQRDLCILRPEGTASLCRYIAKNILERGLDATGFRELKIYYIIPCFRNEGVENLNSTKRREFNQIGLEYVGTPKLDADVEAFYLGYKGLANIARPSDIVARVSDVNIFRGLCNASGYDTETRVRMKEGIDVLSKARVLGKDDNETKSEVEIYLANLSPDIRKAWVSLYSVIGDESSIDEIEKTTRIKLGELKDFFAGLKENGVPVVFDPGMIRGWEYYTGLVCQFDVKTRDKVYAEVAGGGRYNSLIGNFVRRYGIDGDIPATGFAYGTERLVEIALGERK